MFVTSAILILLILLQQVNSYGNISDEECYAAVRKYIHVRIVPGGDCNRWCTTWDDKVRERTSMLSRSDNCKKYCFEDPAGHKFMNREAAQDCILEINREIIETQGLNGWMVESEFGILNWKDDTTDCSC